ncbi:MAG: thioredoxin family protein [Thermodesulfobacteriota bacterium]
MKRNAKWWILGAAAAFATLVVLSVLESRTGPSPFGMAGPSAHGVPAPSPGTGRVTMLDLGAEECVPCKLMAPILEEVKAEYAGKADIVFIDVWKEPEQAKKYGIKAIPTQIFFDARGREAFRNTGVMDKKRIVDALARLGVS